MKNNSVLSDKWLSGWNNRIGIGLIVLCLGVGSISCNRDNDEEIITPAQATVNEESEDVKFMTQSANNNQAIIEYSKIAVQKSTDPLMRDYAQTLIDDHTVAQNDLNALAQSKGMALNTELSSDQSEVSEELSQEDIDKFNEKYIDQIVDILESMEDDFGDVISDGDDIDVNNYANTYLPVIEENHREAEGLDEVYDN